MFQREIDLDVVVIGGGLAGIRAALASVRSGSKTAMLLRGVAGKSGSSAVAGGGLAAVMGNEPQDSIEQHFMDTLASGDFVNDPELVQTVVALAPGAIHELEELGVEFVRKEGELELFHSPGHSYRRSVRCVGGGTARMMGPLSEHIRRRPIQVWENTTVLELLQDRGRVAGIIAVQEGGSLLLFRCRAVVLASGGAGRAFPLTSNTVESTGDGFALALRNGLALTGMEFVQFSPTVLAYPEELKGISTGGVLLGLEGTRLWNKDKERFMEKYDPERKEASTRAIVARAMQKEVIEGRGTRHGGVYLDLTQHSPETLQRMAAHFMKKLRPYDIDITRDWLEIAPAVHYFMGGVEINTAAETALPGLFAAGEVAVGVQGSNRLIDNALTEANVFGRLAGEGASRFASEQKVSDWNVLRKLGRQMLISELGGKEQASSAVELREIRQDIQRVTFASAGLERNEEQLMGGIEKLNSIRDHALNSPAGTNTELKDRYEAHNLLVVAEAVLRSALSRTESRGAHFRSDYPERNDEEWLAVTRVFRVDEKMQVGKELRSQNRRYW